MGIMKMLLMHKSFIEVKVGSLLGEGEGDVICLDNVCRREGRE